MTTADILLSSYIEGDSLDDFLEVMQDHGLLNIKGKAVKSIIWERTEHNKRDKIEDPLERSWLTLSDHHKEFLINEALKGGTNPRSRKFLLSKIPK